MPANLQKAFFWRIWRLGGQLLQKMTFSNVSEVSRVLNCPIMLIPFPNDSLDDSEAKTKKDIFKKLFAPLFFRKIWMTAILQKGFFFKNLEPQWATFAKMTFSNLSEFSRGLTCPIMLILSQTTAWVIMNQNTTIIFSKKCFATLFSRKLYDSESSKSLFFKGSGASMGTFCKNWRFPTFQSFHEDWHVISC